MAVLTEMDPLPSSKAHVFDITVMPFLKAVEPFRDTVWLEEMGGCNFTGMPHFSPVVCFYHVRLQLFLSYEPK